jgi:hypothetical protein
MNLPVTPEPAKNKPTLLVVDDEAGPRDALSVILRPFSISEQRHQPVQRLTR